MQRRGGSIAHALSLHLIDAFRLERFGLAIGGALITTLAFTIPYAGPWLGLGLVAVAAFFYQRLIRETSERYPSNGLPQDQEIDGPSLWSECVLSLLAACFLAAPVALRPMLQPLPVLSRWAILIPAFAGWLVVPLILYFLNVRDRNGRLSLTRALAGVASHPTAMLLTLLIIPLAFVAIEFAISSLAYTQDLLHPFVRTFFPGATMHLGHDKLDEVFRFDDLIVTVPNGTTIENIGLIYRAAARRGFTVAGSLPRALSKHVEMMMHERIISSDDYLTLAIFMALTFFVLVGAGIALGVQADWLGEIALLITPPRPVAAAGNPSVREPDAFLSAPPTNNHLDPTPEPFAEPSPSIAPLALLGPVSANTPVESYAKKSPANALPTLLIVDPDRGFAAGLGRVLSGHGFGIFLASSASEALAIARGAKPDLVVLDTNLPDRSGIDLCRDLRENGHLSSPPIVIASSNIATPDEISAMASAADDYVIKPYVIESLVLRINKHLQGRL